LTIKDLPSLLKKADELFERYDEDGNYFAAENSPAFISLTTGRPSQAVMLQINRVTKERSWLYVQGAPMLTPDGKVSMVLVTSTDITVQKSTEEKMKESEERFRTLANSIPQLAWMTDAEGWIYWYNQRWYDYTGTTLEEMQGWGWQSVHHPDLVEGIKRDFADSIAKGEPYEDTFLLRSKEGGFRWFLTRAVPIKNKKGEIVQWFGTNTDVSAQRETEEALKFAKEQLELTFRNVPSAIYHFDKTGRIIYLNEKGAHQIGYATVEDVLKEKDIFQFRKRLEEIFTVLDEKGKPLAADQNSAALTFKTGKASEVVSQFINKSGSSFWLLSKSSPLYDEKGELTIVLTTATDITLQKTSEKAIRESEDRFRTMAETLPQMIWVRNMDGTIEFASKSWEDYTGIKDISEAWKVMIHPEDWQPIMAVWKNAFTTGISFQYEARIKNKEGEYRWHYAVGEPVKNEWGKVVKYIGALTDINVQKTLLKSWKTWWLNVQKNWSEATRTCNNLHMLLRMI
jgi:PAS domain S-box-containing protein